MEIKNVDGAEKSIKFLDNRSDVMKNLFKTRLGKTPKTGNLVICMVVMLALAGNVFAIPTTFTLDADTVATGSTLDTTALMTPYGSITFSGTIIDIFIGDDPDFNVVASGDAFNILNTNANSGAQTAEIFFGFDVLSVQFVYGGNAGDISVEVQNIGGSVLDSFYQYNTYDGQPAGPVTLSGTGIRSLFWEDTEPDMNYAALDNIIVTVDNTIPVPGSLVLGGIGVSFVGWMRRRKHGLEIL